MKRELAHPHFFMQVGVQAGGIWIIRLGGFLSFHETTPQEVSKEGFKGSCFIEGGDDNRYPTDSFSLLAQPRIWLGSMNSFFLFYPIKFRSPPPGSQSS
jgi:hypothetical protein